MEVSQVMGGTLYLFINHPAGYFFSNGHRASRTAASGHPHREPMHEVEAQVTAAHTPLRPGTICVFLLQNLPVCLNVIYIYLSI